MTDSNLLLVDIGNSRLKWAWWHEGSFLPGGSFPSGRAALTNGFEQFWRKESRPVAVYVANVRGPSAEFEVQAWVDAHWQVPVRFARSEAVCSGVLNAYTQPDRLGVDRWLALLGARREVAGSVCVADCGTALTVDFMDATGQHQGGVIAPGLTVMMESVCKATQGVEAQVGPMPLAWPGRDTTACVEAGAVLACAGLIEKSAREWAGGQGESVSLLLTGGDAARIGTHLALPWRLDEYLVMRGLLTLAEHQT